MRISIALACAAFFSSPGSAATLHPTTIADLPTSLPGKAASDPEISSRYLDLIKSLEKRGASFSNIFTELCAASLASPGGSPLETARDIFGSLYHWTDSGGKPAFQEREDLALHLIYGGLFEAYQGSGQGEAAARAKEEHDAQTPGNSYDLDDLTATLLGAYWASPAHTSLDEFRKNLVLWSDGRKSLRRLPTLIFGRLPPRRVASEEQLEQVRRFVQYALRD